ncbi:MAG: hypothetical protein WA061_02325 [Microgenomates group bacterium]
MTDFNNKGIKNPDDNYGYSQIEGFDDYSYNIISKLMTENEAIWKLLKHNTPDAWKESNLTTQEKRDMIYAGQPDETLYNVFTGDGQISAWVKEVCILRIFPLSLFPQNRTVTTTTIALDIYCHYRTSTLSNYKNRVDVIVKELIQSLNGKDIGVGLGKIFFNAVAAKESRIYESGQIPYKGKRMVMSTLQG